jgi:hypothetical protein
VLEEINQDVSEMRGIKIEGEVQRRGEERVEVHR